MSALRECPNCFQKFPPIGWGMHVSTCSPDRDAELRRAYERLGTLAAVAAETGISKSTAARAVKRAGGDMTKPKEMPSIPQMGVRLDPPVSDAGDQFAAGGRCGKCKRRGTYGVEHECVPVRVSRIGS